MRSFLLGVVTLTPSWMSAIAENAVPETRPSTTSATTAATAPATTVVKRGSLPMKFDAVGYFEPANPVEVRLRFKQYLGELTINEIVGNGETVRKGETLLEIDPAPLRKLLDAAENELAVAKANHLKIEADFKLSEASEALALKNHQDALKDAEDALHWWQTVDGPQMLKGWELQLKQYQHLVEDRTDELEQLKKMYKTEELTSATADIVVKRAIRGLEQAKVGLEMETERVEKSKTIYYPASKRGVDDALAKARQSLASHLVARENLKAQWASTLFTSRTALMAATSKTADLQSDLEKLTVTAPADGAVWYGQLANGNWVGGDPKALRYGEKIIPSAIVFTFYTPGQLRAVVDVAEAKYFSILPGTKAVATPVAFPGMRITGACEAPARTGVITQDRGVVYPVRITAADTDARILPGMKANVHVDVAPVDDVLLVPTTAVVNGEVWVHGKSGRDKRQPVVTGRTDGKSIEIVSGLNERDQVLTQAKP